MSTAFWIAAIVGALVTGVLGTLACRNRNCFLSNVLAAAAGAFALTLAVKQIGVGYADFGTDLGTGMIFAVVGGLVALLFATMVRELSEPETGSKRPLQDARHAARTMPRAVKTKRRKPGEQQLMCADFQRFLQDGKTFRRW